MKKANEETQQLTGKSNRSGSTLVVGIVGDPKPQSKFEVSSGKNARIEIPKEFTFDHVKLAKNDCEILSEILNHHPQEISKMVNSISIGKFSEAKAIANKIGISEENFIQKEGGMWGLVIVIAVGCALLLAHD
ncbi:hypothetical protein COO04_27245 [Bacillus toyonensis]|uniref:hypothetical protein n=1 Tax=Bacillus toyonensis TaxID=155322 RepID=UPI000BEE304E|nr:hypothetical protein [Bacillus toyonensis]PEG13116.1 hypothetical protein COO04_27245 [Bacillus toyonensis]